MTPREMVIQSRAFAWRLEQEQWRTAQIVAAIYDVNRNPKKRRKPITAEDVMGKKRKRGKGARTPEEQLAQFRKITELMGGTIKRRKA